jgi:hypothetical protein
MITLKTIYNIYKATGLNSYLFNSLASSDKALQDWAISKVKSLNFENENDVLVYIAMNI